VRKAATVLAGSCIEALLLSSIIRSAAAMKTALPALRAKHLGRFSGKPDRWEFRELIDMSEALKVIGANTATHARLAKDFRNLIHPGKAIRTKEQCSRGTALSAVAALERVVGDLGRAVPWCGGTASAKYTAERSCFLLMIWL
jgi:hypothetical protein